MPKVFIAAPWPKRAKARDLGWKLEHVGVTIGRRWWDTEDSGEKDYKMHATLDIQGVEEADFLVALVDEKLGVGMWVEVGVALARGKRVFFLNIDDPAKLPVSRSIYDHLATRLTLDGLMEVLRGKRREAFARA